ncbi:hypothetical protein HK103_006566 [Boothiomyces macroporosus]|uniref:Putative sensor domain-containing protein n=1 Tax=Boothiomyces macroporosus TaxID=261099 RepID=A0AAD5UDN3_9FUNG|nr:hypothetical protein HK103_006566 [Boothiomyces macroporosus]
MSRTITPLLESPHNTITSEEPLRYITMERAQAEPQQVYFKEESTFDSLKNPYAWLSYFYGLTIHFAFSIFCLVWVITTFSVSMGLLIIAPIGVPLLYLSCQSWRLLAAVDGALLSYCANEPFQPLKYYYKPNESVVKHFKNTILNLKTWKAGLYLAIYKFIYGVALFSFTIATNPIPWLINPVRINTTDGTYKTIFTDPSGYRLF